MLFRSGTDIQKVVETLVGEADVLSDGFGAFTFKWGQKASDVSGQADPLFGMVERVQTGRQEVGKGLLPVVWRRHVQSFGHDRLGRLRAAPE